MQQMYNEIYKKEIITSSKGVIFAFSPSKGKYVYHPYSHAFSEDAVEKLGELMRHNLLFYAFGEDEVVEYYNKDRFQTLEEAARYAYNQRLPKRGSNADGLPGEVLLDMLIQLYNPDAYKLAVRTIFRQNDNNEIKGYDLTYFTKDKNEIALWLGQAKLGGKEYCKNGIGKDLLQKFSQDYLSKQIYFLCDKRTHINEDAKTILELVETINIRTNSCDDKTRAQSLVSFFKDVNIQVKIPCLLAYGAECVYKDAAQVFSMVEAEVESIQRYYNGQQYVFDGFSPEIVFYIFPIESVERLRDKETGFYAGLCKQATKCYQ